MSSHKRTPGPGPERFPHQRALEQTFDRDLSHLEVHTGQRSALDAIGAGGLAHGNTIAVADQTPTLDLMAHEVTHTIQQGGAGASNSLATSLGDPAENEARGAERAVLAGERVDVGAASTGQLAGDWFTGATIGGVVGGVLGGPLGAVAGGVVGGMIQDAMSDDEAQEEAAEAVQEETPDEELTPRQHAERNIREDEDLTEEQVAQRLAGYDVMRNHDMRDGRLYDDPSNTTVDLSSEEGRMAALNNFSQNHMEHYRGDDEWKNMCGATSMMAAVMAGGGGAGVANLSRSLLANGGEDIPDHIREEMEGIAERAENNELTQWDILTLTDTMHGQMQDFDKANGDDDEPGVTGAAIGNLVEQNPAIMEAMREGGIGLSSVDTDNDGLGNHWVLRLNLQDGDADNNAIYDPMAPIEGEQVRTGSENWETYLTSMPENLPEDQREE